MIMESSFGSTFLLVASSPFRKPNGCLAIKQHIAEVSSQWNGDNHSCKQSFAAEHWDWGLKIAMLGVRKTVLNCVIPGGNF